MTDSNSTHTILVCPLCDNEESAHIGSDHMRSFYQCPQCRLAFVPPNQHLKQDLERERYAHHQNSPEDEGYRKFLNRLFEPMNKLLPPNSSGLDFGCGPGPTLHLLFKQAGHQMAIYDPAFFPNNDVLTRRFNFVTLSEVAEHLHAPKEVFDKLWRMLYPNGRLGIMTRFLTPEVSIESWFYKNDDTHVCFYTTDTFEYLAHRLNAQLHLESNVAILTKPFRQPDTI